MNDMKTALIQSEGKKKIDCISKIFRRKYVLYNKIECTYNIATLLLELPREFFFLKYYKLISIMSQNISNIVS